MTYKSPSPTGNASPGKVFAIAAMGVFPAALDLFIVNIAFPAIQRDFSGSSVSDVSWVLNVYAFSRAAEGIRTLDLLHGKCLRGFAGRYGWSCLAC